MNNEQNADLNSYIVLRDVHQKPAYRALWSSIGGYVLLFDRFVAKVAYVNACHLIQSADTKGITLGKKDAREKLSVTIFEMAGFLSTYGYLTGNLDLQTRAHRVISDITRLDGLELDTEGDLFLGLARGLPAEKINDIAPGDVSITPGKIDLLDTRLETYNLLIGSPRTARGVKTAATANLQTGFDEAEEILKQGLDKLVFQFRDTDFYKEYQSARKSINTAIRHEKPDQVKPSDQASPPVQPQ